MGKSKLLFITHEMSPFLEISKIAEITRHLPQAMQDKGFEIRILMPRFGNINERRNRLHEVIRLSGMNIIINDNDNPLIIKVASIPAARMQVYFLDNEEYFQRKHVFNDKDGKFYADNDERMIFFCKGALETVKKLGWAPDVVHCHGWMSALIPAYLKTTYKDDPTFKNSKVVYSIYENDFKEKLDPDFARKAVMGDMTEEHTELYKEGTNNALYTGAIQYSDAIVLGSEEIDADVLNNVKNSNKLVLDYVSTSDFENYSNFYDEITNEQLVDVA
ncbi:MULTISPECIES: glycogen/starch synthase [unclassified Mucilaginibacter]|uniref:glycogen/starch synthase n=1 Tax=unclassified Mucilaginibacter TaxID=2617802 RepID=UPI0009620293|nr:MULTISPECIES: glycogen/starch synthase [unclassified Mucilaginibacter]OJW17651.1 MAG: starch synthase [Mucilaginibacter sp. 44-25]PLW90208.1 MAG: starch synthase [Mucilaginibacter sp.]PMP64704.1 MAG: starch synthase [Mucilaginibacter sp.]HEK19742.1 starch synthase [Bacteroidota bacterium]